MAGGSNGDGTFGNVITALAVQNLLPKPTVIETTVIEPAATTKTDEQS